MNFDEVKHKIAEWLNPILTEKDFFLVDIKISAGKRIEVYVDADQGIHIDDCAFLSRQLEKNLDESGIVPENYVLEVSSPGMSNPLKVYRQYLRRIGQTLEVVKPNGERIEGKLIKADENGFVLQEIVLEKKKKKKETQRK
jgi:ribosome maturation factor RimP